VSPLRASRRRLSVAFAAGLVAALALVSLGGGSAAAATCPTFRVLHNDRIGAANLPAGNYELTVDAGLDCRGASKLFARFLQDWDGNLPGPWHLVAAGNGKASFVNKGYPGFSVSRVELPSDGGNELIGRLCPGTFTVNAGTRVDGLLFAKGRYLIYLPRKSAMPCRRAAILFTRFLASPGGELPEPWHLSGDTATFEKYPHFQRSAFRIEPANGVS